MPASKEPSEATANQYLQIFKDAMKVHMYFPHATGERRT